MTPIMTGAKPFLKAHAALWVALGLLMDALLVLVVGLLEAMEGIGMAMEVIGMAIQTGAKPFSSADHAALLHNALGLLIKYA